MVMVRSQPLDLQATFTNDLSRIYAMHQFVRQAAIEAGFSNAALGDIELAVVEACANVIKHAYRERPANTARLDIRVQFDWGQLVITLTDWGEAFEPPRGKIPRPDVDQMLARNQRGGMGLFFMQELMDEVAWDIRPAQYNRLRMLKKLA